MTQRDFSALVGIEGGQYCEVTRCLRASFGRRAMHKIVAATNGQVTYKALMEWDRDRHWGRERDK